MDLGSIFTSSASGSCSRRPMDTAPRTRDVQVGELLARDLGRGVHRRPALVDRRRSWRRRQLAGLLHARTKASVSRPAVPLPTAIGLEPVAADQLRQGAPRPRPTLPLVRIDRAVCSSRSPLSSSATTLQPVRKPGVDGQHAAAAQRRGQEQVLEVRGEDADGLLVGALLHGQAHVHLDRGPQQALVGVVDGLAELGAERGLAPHDARAHHADRGVAAATSSDTLSRPGSRPAAAPARGATARSASSANS